MTTPRTNNTVPATADQLRQLLPPSPQVREQFLAPVHDPVAEAEERLHARSQGRRRAATRPRNVNGSSLVTRRGGRYYANFTSPFDGRRVRSALCPPGQGQGTTDPVEAARLAQALWLDEYDKAERRKMGVDVNPDMAVGRVMASYLGEMLKRVERGEIGRAHARQTGNNLRRLVEQTSLGSVEDMRKVKGPLIKKLIDELRELTYVHPITKKVGRFSENMIRQHMAALSGLFRALREDGHMDHNPVERHRSIPSATPPDGSKFLEIAEAAALIEFLRHRRRHYGNPYIYEIVMILLFTGARVDEVMRMQPSQVDFVNNVIVICGTKTEHSRYREVPLWPPLRECLERFFAEFRPHGWPLLFPVKGKGAQLSWRKRRGMYGTLSKLAKAAGIPKHVTHHYLRHTYASARLSMVMRNAVGQLVPTSPEVVRLELGHSPKGEAHTLEKIYSHALRGPGVQLEYLDYELAARAPRVARNSLRDVAQSLSQAA
jgi:integrase